MIPASIRERAGLSAGSELEITETEDGLGIRLERIAAGPRLVKIGRRLVARPTVPPTIDRRSTSRRSSRKSGTAGHERLPRHERPARRPDRLRPAERARAVASCMPSRKKGAGTRDGLALLPRIFSVATRLPPEFRVAPADAVMLLQEEVFARMTVHDLPAADRVPMLRAAGARRRRGRSHLRRAHRGGRPRRRRGGRRHRQSPPLPLGAPLRHPRRDARGISRRTQREAALTSIT